MRPYFGHCGPIMTDTRQTTVKDDWRSCKQRNVTGNRDSTYSIVKLGLDLGWHRQNTRRETHKPTVFCELEDTSRKSVLCPTVPDNSSLVMVKLTLIKYLETRRWRYYLVTLQHVFYNFSLQIYHDKIEHPNMHHNFPVSTESPCKDFRLQLENHGSYYKKLRAIF